MASDARPLRGARLRGDEPADADRARARALGALDRALAECGCARGRGAGRGAARVAGPRLPAPRPRPARVRAADRARGLAGAPDRPPRRRALHGRRNPLLRVRGTGAPARRERPARARAPVSGRPRRRVVGARGRADGRRAHALPRPPALRGLPAGARLPRRARGLLGPRGAPAPPGTLRRLAARPARRTAARGARRRAARSRQAIPMRHARSSPTACSRCATECSSSPRLSLPGTDDRADRAQPRAADRPHDADGVRRGPRCGDDRRAALGQRRDHPDRGRLRAPRRLRSGRLPVQRVRPDRVAAADHARRPARAQSRRRAGDAAAPDRRQGAPSALSVRVRRRSRRILRAAPGVHRRRLPGPRRDRDRLGPRRGRCTCAPAPSPRSSSTATASRSPASTTRGSPTRTRAASCRWRSPRRSRASRARPRRSRSS